MATTCYQCGLRACGLFKPVSPEELDAIFETLEGQIALRAGAEIVRAGYESPELYTLYSGWAFGHKTLADGRR
jgi:CRP/FNR family transcriptional regulator, anaerobic regulatory protein